MFNTLFANALKENGTKSNQSSSKTRSNLESAELNFEHQQKRHKLAEEVSAMAHKTSKLEFEQEAAKIKYEARLKVLQAHTDFNSKLFYLLVIALL